jgi:multidrug efflux system outer membrane protein
MSVRSALRVGRPAGVSRMRGRLRSKVHVMYLRHIPFAGRVLPRCAPALARGTKVFGAVCLVQALAGCFVDTEKPELKLEVPDRYRLAQGAVDAAPPALDWWRSFRSAELTSLVEEAQTANFDIAVAIANILQADAQVRTAGAALLPDASGSGTITRSRASTGGTSSSGGKGGGPSIAPDRTTYQVLGNASYILDFWGQNRAALLAADENAVAKRYAREVVVLTTVSNVANAYLQVLAAQDRLRVARDDVAAASRILTLIRERMSVGTASSLEVSQQEALLANLRASVPPLEITLRQNEATLALLLGRAPEHLSIKGGSLDTLTAPRVTPGLPSELLNQRPDIRQTEAELKSTNHSVESARAAFFPSIQLTSQAGFQSLALASLFGTPAFFYSAAASVTQPIFDGGLKLGAFELAQGQQVAALQTYRKSVISAFTDVENALVALQQQTTRERLQADAVKSSREAFNISETRLREGTLDLVTLLNTQQTLFQAQDTLIQVRLARFLGVVSLFQSLGGGWPPHVKGERPA